VNEGLDIVRVCRDRYDGRIRNPFNEYECGHWYARAMSSYALLQGLSGARYDAVDKVLYLRPSLPGDFRCFLSTATGYGTVGVKDGKPFFEVRSGTIEVREIKMDAGSEPGEQLSRLRIPMESSRIRQNSGGRPRQHPEFWRIRLHATSDIFVLGCCHRPARCSTSAKARRRRPRTGDWN